MSVPDQHYAGDTLEFPVKVPDFLSSDGWTLVYKLDARFGSPPTQAAITLTAIAQADGSYIVGETATNTAAWSVGLYNWWRFVERTVSGTYQRQTLDDAESRGEIVILQNPATAAQGFDNRSQAKKAYDNALTALANAMAARAASTTGLFPTELMIGDKRTRYATPELAHLAAVQAVVFWAAAVDDEDAIAEGRTVGPMGRIRYGITN